MKLQSTNKEKEPPPHFGGRFNKDGGLDLADITRVKLREFAKANPGMPFELKPLFPESIKQRKYFEGCLCQLLTFYQEGLDHRNYKDVDKVREWLKIEFNAEIVIIGNKPHKVAKSTKNLLNQGFLERVMEYILENYSPPMEVVDPKKYQDWKDRIFPKGGADNYIDYLAELNLIK